MRDNADPWGMRVTRFRSKAGAFRLLPRAAGSRFSGLEAGTIPSVRVIEDGPVRSVVEAVFGWGDSFICQQYKLPKEGAEIEVDVRVLWNEKDRMLKLSVPTPFRRAAYRGQTAYGVNELETDGSEMAAQKWTAVVDERRGLALTCINDGVHGSDMESGELRLSLLRSAAYAGHPVGARPILVRDRLVPRIDQGEHVFRFWLQGGDAAERLARVDREALVKNETPFALACFPSGQGRRPEPGVTLSDRSVQVAAVKRAERGNDLIIRLFEPTGRRRTTTVTVPFAAARTRVTLRGFEIKTLRCDRRTGTFREVDLMEEPLK
jgi:alpha-mannosidase